VNTCFKKEKTRVISPFTEGSNPNPCTILRKLLRGGKVRFDKFTDLEFTNHNSITRSMLTK